MQIEVRNIIYLQVRVTRKLVQPRNKVVFVVEKTRDSRAIERHYGALRTAERVCVETVTAPGIVSLGGIHTDFHQNIAGAYAPFTTIEATFSSVQLSAATASTV